MAQNAEYQRDQAQDIAIRALTFLTSDETLLQRFLQVSGISPATLGSTGSESAILAATLDYLMSEEDLLLTFAANSGLDPRGVVRAHHTLQGNGTNPETRGD